MSIEVSNENTKDIFPLCRHKYARRGAYGIYNVWS